MKLDKILNEINLKQVYIADVNREIESGYCCDLLSEVMGKAKENSIWITVHSNLNVIAVAAMLEIAVVVIAEGHSVNDEFLKKAEMKGISVLETNENSFELTGQLYNLGIRG